MRDASEFLTHYHYLKGRGNFGRRFGLYTEQYGHNVLIGVLTFGQASRQLVTSAFTAPVTVFELNRLAIRPTDMPKNLASFFVARTLRILRQEGLSCAIVSFADTAQSHVGTVYQAANFIYNGLSQSNGLEYWIGNQWVQERAFYNMGITKPRELELRTRALSAKHRYWYFLGSHKQRAWFHANLRVRPVAYPKHELVTGPVIMPIDIPIS